MNIEINRIGIITRRDHPDIVCLYTKLPEALWPFKSLLDLQFRAAQGSGLDYVRKHFPGIPIWMVDDQENQTEPENPTKERTHEGSEADVLERQAADGGGDHAR